MKQIIISKTTKETTFGTNQILSHLKKPELGKKKEWRSKSTACHWQLLIPKESFRKYTCVTINYPVEK